MVPDLSSIFATAGFAIDIPFTTLGVSGKPNLQNGCHRLGWIKYLTMFSSETFLNGLIMSTMSQHLQSMLVFKKSENRSMCVNVYVCVHMCMRKKLEKIYVTYQVTPRVHLTVGSTSFEECRLISLLA